MQDSVYYKKNTYKKLLLSVVKFLFFSAVTYLFSMMNLYENDISERRNRIPLLKEFFEKKLTALHSFQQGSDLWKESRYRH